MGQVVAVEGSGAGAETAVGEGNGYPAIDASTLARRLQLQQVLSEVSKDLINLPPDQIEQHLKAALGKLALLFGFNVAALTYFSEDGKSAEVRHVWTAPGLPAIPEGFTEKEFPWSAARLLQGINVFLPTLAELPPAAAVDRSTFEQYGASSSYSRALRTGEMVVGVLGLVSIGATRPYPAEYSAELELFEQMLSSAVVRKRAAVIISRTLSFEQMLTEISSRLLRCTAREASPEVERALRLVAEFFNVERCIFWELSEDEKLFTVTHSYHGQETIPTVLASDSLPWFIQELRSGRSLCLQGISDLPPEAQSEREYWTVHQLKSALLVPIHSDRQLKGCLTLAATGSERTWLPETVRRLQLAGEIFANTLARTRVEEALRKSQERLTLAADSAGTGMWRLDLGSDWVWMTKLTRELFCLPEETPVSKEMLLNRVHPDDRELIVQTVEAARGSEARHRVEFRVLCPDATFRWVLARGSVHKDSTGKPDCFMGVAVDLSAEKRAQEALKESEARFRTLVENAGDGVEVLDPQGRYIDVNSATLDQLGYRREELLKLTVFDVDPSLKPEQFAEARAVLATGTPLRVESLHRRSNGTTFPVEVSVSQIQLGGLSCILTLVRDITARKAAEEALLKSYGEIERLKDRLLVESDYLKEEMKTTQSQGDIIGSSRGIQKVLRQIEQVAGTNSSVLIGGETGTGKELVANAIHRGSQRKDHLMVMVNCAALPSALVESELFGRERGAYTGALTRQAGRFEVADGSTIFLDEIGDLSLDVQAKLLRVLEVGEFERLGSAKTIKVNVRLLAATHRNLAEDVRKQRFRADLYYRLNVFPIQIPPLRERFEDIPELVWTFVQQFSKRMGKSISKIPRNAMEALQRYRWPGNVRQLRNVIEHSVIVSNGETLRLTLPEDPQVGAVEPTTLADHEREHILRTLELVGWRIKGPKGAALMLGLKPSTLYTRMRKLKIPTKAEKLGL